MARRKTHIRIPSVEGRLGMPDDLAKQYAAPDPLDPAAVEAAKTLAQHLVRRYGAQDSEETRAQADDLAQVVLTAYLDRSGLADVRASLERAEQYGAWAVAEVQRERDEAVARAEKAEQREEWDKQERKRLLARAERAEADLAVCREALEKATHVLDEVVRYFDGGNRLPPAGFPLASVVRPGARSAREALSRLAHSSEEER